MQLSLSLEELSALVAPEKRLDGTDAAAITAVTGVAALDEAAAGDLSFLGNLKYTPQVAETAASVVLLPPDYAGLPKPAQIFLFVKDPSSALARVCARVEEKLWPRPAPGIHPTAVIDPTAKLGTNLHIGPYCVIEAGASIGDNSILEAYCYVGREAVVGADNWFRPRATLAEYCVTGQRVKLFFGAVVGGEGFGFETVNGSHRKIPQIGNVVLEDDVELGANATIDRARFASTRVGSGTKIDNLVQVGHNCRIGRHCILVSQSGIAGSTTLEDYVVLAGQAGLAGHLRIGRGAQVGAQCGVMSDIPAGARVLGSPAMPAKEALRVMAIQQRLPEINKRLAAAEAKLAALEKSDTAQ
ncbi:MAG: UDP-3-O-(3-hydroxymyristoyl)glucosamine N-acyltransferase [Puniceicoccales bacterium]|jgi:UDP-3-O-[3-hydroxymyristoyl] glucosamine N-acyltransferase|nr:UDP-3-O-(3-hydroxymyristoyl)glucosamine N-acyltransferase [Puniceicoccales bacterium]